MGNMPAQCVRSDNRVAVSDLGRFQGSEGDFDMSNVPAQCVRSDNMVAVSDLGSI